VYVPGHVLQALRPVVDGVHGRDVGKECLGCADVGGGLVPPDVLLPGLQGQPEALVPIRVLGHPDHPARHVPHVLALRGEEPGMWTAVTQGNSKPLTRPEGNVHSKLSRRLQNGQGHQISGTDGQCSMFGCFVDHCSEVLNGSSCVRILEDHATDVLAREVGLVDVDHLDGDPKRSGSGFHTADRLWVQLV